MKEKKGIVYIATNQINGMKYVGQTTKTLTERRKNGYNNYFTRALNKYKFNWTEIVVDVSELDLWERFYIKHYSTMYPNGYNFESGGRKNKTVSNVSREKVSIAQQGKNNSFYGKKHSIGTKHKMSKAKEGNAHTNAVKQKISKSLKGRRHTIARRYKQATAQSSKWEIIKPSGKIELVINLKQYCRVHNLSSGAMNAVAKNKRKHHKGYKCKKIDI